MARRTEATFVGAAALVIAAAGLWYTLRPAPPPPSRPSAAAAATTPERPARPRVAAPAAARPSADPTADPAAPPPLPRSLAGTDVDDALRVDDQGRLVLGPEVIRFFNYFFSATGEETDEAIRARVLAAIRERLDEPAAGQAVALLDKYMSLRQAARDQKDGLGSEAEPSARLEAIRRLRREHFTEDEASALFGAEEQEDAVAAAKSEIARDPKLSPEERAEKIAALDAELPEEARKAREESRQPLNQQAEEASLRAAGATDEEIRQHRVATVGVEAADRLQDLDQQRADFQQRVDAFRQERARLVASDPDARRVAELALLEKSFSPPEQLRVRALLKIKGEPLEM